MASYSWYRDRIPSSYEIFRGTYKHHSDICAVCGMAGGSHYTREGISYCYDDSNREKYEDDRLYQTSFTYSIEDSAVGEDNPNSTFKKTKEGR